MSKLYHVQREVIEWIDVRADSEEEADTNASEHPPDFWVRDIKSTEIEEVPPDSAHRVGPGAFMAG